jgi:hypothetical protein
MSVNIFNDEVYSSVSLLFSLADAVVCQATEEKAENARLSSFVGALALGDLVKSTLGPKGMNKILQSVSSGDINVTNDGATILKAIQLDNAAAKILVNISKVQDDEVGDGTTSVTVLAAELLREAEKLIGLKIHPQTIVEGYRIASAAALKALEEAAVDHGYVVALRTVVTFLFDDFFGISPSIKVRCCNVPERPGEYCSDDAFVKGVGSGQELLFKPRRRCRPTVESERALLGGCIASPFLLMPPPRDRRTWIIFRSSKKSAES